MLSMEHIAIAPLPPYPLSTLLAPSFMGNSHESPCIACPFNDGLTDEATQGQNYGCLPSPTDMLKLWDEQQIALSCHGKQDIACRGLAATRNVTNGEILAYGKWYRGAMQ